MKRTFLLVFTVFISLLVVFPVSARGSSSDVTQASEQLTVYCYDSFNSEWGPGLQIAEAFKESTGITINFVAPGDGVTVLNQLIIEKGKSSADVVVGLDNSLLGRALSEDLLEPYESPGLSVVPANLLIDNQYRLLPYDFGYFAICYDAELINDIPGSLEALTDERYRDSLVLMDPRTSTPGLGFLLWTVAAYGDKWPDYWNRLKPSILTISDGWSQAYALFTAGEAPLVLSYSTSPVYHSEYEGTDRYRAAEFSDGHVLQVEGMGIIKGSSNRDAAEQFIDFMLGDQAQSFLAMSNIMMPVNPSLELPESFEMAMSPNESFSLETMKDIGDQSDVLIRRWLEIFGL